MNRVKKDFYRQLRGLVIPVAIQSFMLAAVNAGDVAMLGFVEQSAVSAVSLATQISFIFSLIVGAFTHGSTVMLAQYWGKGDHITVGKVFARMVTYAVPISLIFTVSTACFPTALMNVFTTDAELIAIGATYLQISSLSYLLSGISQCWLCIMKVTGKVKQSSLISSSALILDTILNAIFIFGLFGLPAMGAYGAALTTVAARAAELLLIFLVIGSNPLYKLSGQNLFHVSPSLTRDFWKYTFPILINSAVWGFGVSTMVAIIGRLGNDATAANSIASVVRNLLVCVGNGIGAGGGILLGKVLGANQLELARSYGKWLSRLSILCGLVSATLLLLCSPIIRTLLPLTPAANEYLHEMLWVCAAYVFAQCINMTVINGIFAAGGDTRFDAYSIVVTMWCIGIPLSFAAAFWWKLPVIWVYLFTCLDEIGKLPWVYLHYKRYLWVKNITHLTSE